MQRWEYEIAKLSESKDRDMIPLLDSKGKSGWELVSVVASLARGEYLAFLKRPVK
jgi:hypothetical protein